MRGLLRYIVMKAMRERHLQPLLFFPSIMFVSPLLVLGVYNVFRGRNAWPASLASNLSPSASADILTIPAILSAAIMATTAAFWLFRAEMTGRTIGFFVLAQPRSVPPLSSIIAATALSVSSYLITVILLALVTQSSMSVARESAFVALSSILVGATVGAFFVGLSPELPILVPAYAITGVASIYMLDVRPGVAPLAGIAVSICFALAATLSWRRRWAA